LKKTKFLNIALSIIDDIDNNRLYSNGAFQNILFLYDLFEQLGHNLFLVTKTPRQKQKIIFQDDQSYNTLTLDEINNNKQSIDLFFEAGQVQTIEERHIIKLLGAKIISVHFGNSLIMDMEEIIYKDEKKSGQRHVIQDVDHVLVCPHHAYHKSYLEVLYNTRASIMPFIWNPKFIQNKNFSEKDFRNPPNIYVLEPNISVVKNCLIPMTIIESLYRKKPNSFNEAYILNGLRIKDNDYLLKNIIINMPSLNANAVKDKVFFSKRFKFYDAFNCPDILLSHHWNNSLNYLSLEALYQNIPLVHNSECLKEVGYFYPDFDVHKGALALEDALKNHKNGFLKNRENNQLFLEKYSIYNNKIQEKYKDLLNDIMTNY